MESRQDEDQPRGAARVLARYRELVLRRFGHDVERVVLFGSRARRDEHADSDWDVAVFLKRPISAADLRSVSVIGHDVMCETGATIQSMALPAGRPLAGRRRAYPQHPARRRADL
jgi:predicted nucleotidyltransferase